MRHGNQLSRLGLGMAIAGAAVVVLAGTGYAHSVVPQGRAELVLPPSQAAARLSFANAVAQNAHLLAVDSNVAKANPSPGEPATRISIPAIHVNSPVIRTLDTNGVWQTADWAVGYLQGSANPGFCSFFAGRKDCATDLAAHDDIKGEIFKNINMLHTGQPIYLYTKHRVLTYAVTGKRIVDPSRGSVLFSTKKEIVLVSCVPYWVDSHRIIVLAGLRHVHTRHLAKRAKVV